MFYKASRLLHIKKYCWIKLSPSVQYSSLLPYTSSGRVSVPMWLNILSDQLNINGLVGSNPANNLIFHKKLNKRKISLL